MKLASNSDQHTISGGDITGCGVRTFTCSSDIIYCGGISGVTTSLDSNSFISSCYVANIILNGKYNGSISGSDGDMRYKHRITHCIVDNTNGYEFIGGDNVRSTCGALVLSVPADSGLVVDGVLSVLNASGSGYVYWHRSSTLNKGYPYPQGMF